MQLHFQSFGEGYPLIILHGLFGSSENWRTLSRRFSTCYRVLAVDLRNHGASPHSDVFNYAVMAEDVRELMQTQHLSSAYVLGHSMGGKVAMQLALTHPESVDKLVVVDIAPSAYPPHHDEILEALLTINPGAYRRRMDVDAALAPRLPDERLRQFLLKNLTRDESGAFRWKIDLPAISRNYNEILAGMPTDRKYEKPALFIRSELSGYIGPRDIPLIRSLFPYAKLVDLHGVGHWVHVEAQRQFARLVLAFLGT